MQQKRHPISSFFSPTRYYFACDAVYSLTYFLNQEQTVEVTLITDFQILCSTASVRQKQPFSSDGDSFLSVFGKWNLQVRGEDKWQISGLGGYYSSNFVVKITLLVSCSQYLVSFFPEHTFWNLTLVCVAIWLVVALSKTCLFNNFNIN